MLDRMPPVPRSPTPKGRACSGALPSPAEAAEAAEGLAKAIGAKVIALCTNKESALGSHADLVLELGEAPEACPLGLAPTVSTTKMLACRCLVSVPCRSRFPTSVVAMIPWSPCTGPECSWVRSTASKDKARKHP